MTGTLKSTFAAGGLFALFGLSRYLDGFIRIFLRQKTGEAFLSAVARNWRPGEMASEVLCQLGFGFCLWLTLVLTLAWFFGRPKRDQLPLATLCFTPLLLPVALTILASLSLLLSPRFPYGLNLVLTIAYEGAFVPFLVWGLIGVSIASMVFRAMGPLPRIHVSARATRWWLRTGGAAVLAAATFLFASATPSRFWRDGQGQGNMFKYVRMAAAMAGAGTLDIAQAEVPPGWATPTRFLGRLPGVAKRSAKEATELLKAAFDGALSGKIYVGRIRATRAGRSMFRSHQGGIYYINAPGPGLLLVPAYLVDRALNRKLGWDRQIAVVLFWNFLGALLVLEMVRAARQVAGSWGPAVATAFALAVSPPLFLYTFQVYPELPAALGLLYSFRKLMMEARPTRLGVLAASLFLAFLPWLHQKYSVAAAALGLMAAVRLLRGRGGNSQHIVRLGLLVGPLALSAFSILVYNHALTGSVLPDATFRAVGRTSFEPQHMLRGLLGLVFDAENGLFVYSPAYLLAFLAACRFSRSHRRVYLPLLIVALSYLVVIASFPHWPGAVSSVARYILSVAPLAALPMVLVVRRSLSDGVLAGVVLMLLAATFSMTVSFQKDLVASYEPSLLLHRTLYSDPYQYVPNFLSEGILGSGPAHFYKLAVIAIGLGWMIWRLSPRVSSEPALFEKERRLYPGRATLGAASMLGFIVVAGAFLEQIPSNITEKTGPDYRLLRPLRRGSEIELAVEGKFGFERRGVWVPAGGTTRFLVQSPRPLTRLRMAITNVPRENRVQVVPRGAPPLDVELLSSSREVMVLPLRQPYVFKGPAGSNWIYSWTVRSRRGVVPSKESRSEDSRHLGCYVVVN